VRLLLSSVVCSSLLCQVSFSFATPHLPYSRGADLVCTESELKGISQIKCEKAISDTDNADSLGTTAIAQEDDSIHTHGGFLLSVSLSAGYGYAHNIFGPSSPSAADFGPTDTAEELFLCNLLFYLGYTFGDIFVLAGELSYMIAPLYRKPKNFFSTGPAVRFYLPLNFFVGTSFNIGVPYIASWSLAIGKEFWISNNWGLGLVARGYISGPGYGYSSLLFSGSLGISATYN
jgi:hypothetical protein